MKTPAWLYATGRIVNQNSPSILSAIGIGGVIATAYLTAKAAVKSDKKIDSFLNSETEVNLTTRDKVELVWRFYIPPTLAGAATISCIIGANQIGLRRQAAYLGAYTLADAAFREYKDEVLSQIGAGKESKIQDGVAAKQIQNNPVDDKQIIITQGGDSLCYDQLTGRYFKSDIESIRQAGNDVNANIVNDMYAPLNDFYELLGLGHTTIGEELGFNIENLIKLRFSSHLAQDGQPCLAVGFENLPRPDFGKF
jgi:hypothetical protein